mmetsp:Transcript_78298/g.155137  ORF Transcript_78298/g.155137 Transcript_78298/m.155137 type:complete len:118 (-) Transcript_78298:146-499(-)
MWFLLFPSLWTLLVAQTMIAGDGERATDQTRAATTTTTEGATPASATGDTSSDVILTVASLILVATCAACQNMRPWRSVRGWRAANNEPRSMRCNETQDATTGGFAAQRRPFRVEAT